MATCRAWRAVVLAPVALAACATAPMGPTVQVMPGTHKTFEAFNLDDAGCRQYAQGQVAGQAEAANNRAVGAAVLGTVLGAGLGAAIGGGRGAAIGAASGAGLGTGVGADGSAAAQGGIQFQYDNSYSQCMYSHGDRVAGWPDPDPPVPVAQQTGHRAVARRAARPAEPAQANWVAPTGTAPASAQAAPAAGASSGWVQPVSAKTE